MHNNRIEVIADLLKSDVSYVDSMETLANAAQLVASRRGRPSAMACVVIGKGSPAYENDAEAEVFKADGMRYVDASELALLGAASTSSTSNFISLRGDFLRRLLKCDYDLIRRMNVWLKNRMEEESA